MQKEKVKSILLVVFAVCLVIMTVAYAALTQTLVINSSAKVSKNDSWDVHFGTPSAGQTSGYATITTGKELVLNGSTTLEGLEVNFKAPGDSVTYTFDVVNGGSIDAKIESITLPNIANATYSASNPSTETADIALVKANLTYSLTYDGDSDYGNATPAVNNTLAHGASRPLKLVITYSGSATDVPIGTVTVTGLTTSINYVQN